MAGHTSTGGRIAIVVLVLTLLIPIVMALLFSKSISPTTSTITILSTSGIRVILGIGAQINAQLGIFLLSGNGTLLASTQLNQITYNNSQNATYAFYNLTPYTEYVIRVNGTVGPYCGPGVPCAQYLILVNKTAYVTTGQGGSIADAYIKMP